MDELESEIKKAVDYLYADINGAQTEEFGKAVIKGSIRSLLKSMDKAIEARKDVIIELLKLIPAKNFLKAEKIMQSLHETPTRS